MKFLILILSVLFITTAQAQYNPASDLRTFFGGRCDSNGIFNSQAQMDSSNLRAVWTSIKDDPNCNGVEGVLDQLTSPNQGDLLYSQVTINSTAQLKNETQQLELAIASELALDTDNDTATASDPAYMSALQEELLARKTDLVLSSSSTDAALNSRKLDTYSSFQPYANALFSELGKYNSCFTKHPNLFAQIGAQIMGLSSNLVSGIYGSLLLTSGDLIDHYLAFLKNRKIANEIRKSVNADMGDSVGCAMEAMARTYCEARDVEIVLDEISKNQNAELKQTKMSDPAWQGLNLISHDMPALNQWLGQLSSGSSASSQAQAQEKKSGNDLDHTMKNLREDVQGAINTAWKKVNLSGSLLDSDKRNLMNTISKYIQTASFDNGYNVTATVLPMKGVFADDTYCGPYAFVYTYATGDAKYSCPLDASLDFNDCTRCVARVYYNNPTGYPPLQDLATIEAAANFILSKGEESVAREVSFVKESDARRVINAASAPGINYREPISSMKVLIDFLNQLTFSDALVSESGRDFINDTVSRLSQSLEVLADNTKSAQEKVSSLGLLLTPNSDALYLSKRVGDIVRQEISKKVISGELKPDLNLILQLSSQDNLSTFLSKYVGTQEARIQIEKAKYSSTNNLESLSDSLGEYLVKQIKKLSGELREKNTVKSTVKNLLSMSCIQTLLTKDTSDFGRRQKRKVAEYCRDTVYVGEHGERLDYNLLSRKHFEDRICVLYDFYRKSRVKDMGNSIGFGKQ